MNGNLVYMTIAKAISSSMTKAVPMSSNKTMSYKTTLSRLTSWSSFCFSLRRTDLEIVISLPSYGWLVKSYPRWELNVMSIAVNLCGKINLRVPRAGWSEVNDFVFPILVNRSVHSKSRGSPLAVRCLFLTLDQGWCIRCVVPPLTVNGKQC